MNNTHSALTGAELHVPGYGQIADPGAVGAGLAWVDQSGGGGKWALKIRKADNSGWETIYNPASVAILGGSINNTPIGATTPSTGAFTTLSASGGLNGTAIGATTPAAGTFTALTATGALAHQGSTAGFYNAAPVSRQTYGAPAGSVSRASFTISSVTTAGLAAVVGALVTDLRSVGLLG